MYIVQCHIICHYNIFFHGGEKEKQYRQPLTVYLLSIYNFVQLHEEKECPAYPVVCEKCNKEGIPRAKVQL